MRAATSLLLDAAEDEYRFPVMPSRPGSDELRDDAVRETLQVGPPALTPRRHRLGYAAAAVVAVVAGVAAVGSAAGWFDDDEELTPTATAAFRPVPSTPRALTAAVLAHIPRRGTVVWSSGASHLARVTPGIGPAAALRTTLVSELLLRAGNDDFLLSVTTGPANEARAPDTLAHGVMTRDRRGRAVREVVSGSSIGIPTVVSESASPTSHGHLPLSDAQLRAIVADPRVGVLTDPATLARARHLSGYVAPPPRLSWGL